MEPKTLTIQVTKEDIHAADVARMMGETRSTTCPVAQAIKRQGEYALASIGRFNGHLYTGKNSFILSFPEDVADTIHIWDEHKVMAPFEFEAFVEIDE